MVRKVLLFCGIASSVLYFSEHQGGDENETGLERTPLVIGKARSAVFRSSCERAKESAG